MNQIVSWLFITSMGAASNTQPAGGEPTWLVVVLSIVGISFCIGGIVFTIKGAGEPSYWD